MRSLSCGISLVPCCSFSTLQMLLKLQQDTESRFTLMQMTCRCMHAVLCLVSCRLLIARLLQCCPVCNHNASHLTSISHQCCASSYTGCLQMYASCTVSDQLTATDCLLACVSQIDRWMSSSQTKLNSNKTELV